MLGRRKKNEKHRRTWKSVGAGLVAVMLVIALAVGMIPNDAGEVFAAKNADADTSDRYTESLGSNESTEYSGRIWTDKSVYSESATFDLFGGGSATVKVNADEQSTEDDDEDFLVAFSALGSSMAVSGKTKAPVDVVFVIDTSGSMQYDMSSTDSTNRIDNTVTALNDAIDSVMKLNEYTRVAVVAFSEDAEVLLPLGRYSQGTRTFGGRQGSETITDYVALRNNNVYAIAVPDGSTDRVDTDRRVNGGTNIQMGVYEGMNILANASTTATINGSTVKRIPSVVILSDGAPTFSSDSASWWTPEDNANNGPGGSPYYGNGMKVLMTGAYMKEVVNDHYGVDTTVYTIGMGISGLTNYEENDGPQGGPGDDDEPSYTGEQHLAYMTLDPETYWNNDTTDTTNAMSKAIREAWEMYTKAGGTTPVTVTTNSYETYTFNHPEAEGIIDIADLDDEDTTVNPLTGFVDDYYDADSAGDVTDVFHTIVSNISINTAEVPTELNGMDAIDEDGFITYTDPIGQYMEVKDIKEIIYAGVEYKTKETPTVSNDGKTTTYTFEGEVHSPVYGDQHINDIKIIVTTETDGSQTLQVKIPASVIPVRVNTVTLDADGNVTAHTDNGAYPVRVLYTVGLRDGIVKDGVVQTSELSQAYIDANTNDDGTINFYSNLYSGNEVDVMETIDGVTQTIPRTVGDATVEFEPSHSNPFYYMQENMIIYSDPDCTVPVPAGTDLEDGGKYYYKELYYENLQKKAKLVERTGAQLERTDLVDEGDYLARAAGSPRLNRIMVFEGTKTAEENKTGTAADFYTPTFIYGGEDGTDAYEGFFRIYLGNNGVLSVPSSGALEISKDVVIPANHEPATTSFEFTIDFNGEDVLEGAYAYEIVNADGAVASNGTIADDGKIYLSNGQTVRIKNLPHGTTYTVVEGSANGYTTTVDGVETNTASGTIEAGETSAENFVNTYSVSSITWPAQEGLSGKKVFKGRAWSEQDQYTFVLTPYNNAPLPTAAGSANELAVSVKDATKVSDTEEIYEALFEFGSIEFKEPGTYRYTIFEREPATDAFLPGVSYSRALYRVVITVSDDGDGTMTATSDIQRLYDDNATPLFTYNDANEIVMNSGEEAQDDVVFTNTYNAEAVVRVPVAVKDYTDTTGEKPLASGMFSFRITPIGYLFDGGSLVETTDIPQPQSLVTENEGINITFNSVTFTQADLRGQSAITYRYIMEEIIPDGADASNNYTLNGMQYDPKQVQAEVRLWLSADSSVLNVSATYDDLSSTTDDGRLATFTNVYEPESSDELSLQASKILTGRDLLADDKFTFELRAVNDAAKEVLTQSMTATSVVENNSLTNATFAGLTFTKLGTYEFEITEVLPAEATEDNNYTYKGIKYDTHTSKVVVEVTDNNGKLVATPVYDDDATKTSAAFTNEYTTTYKGTPISLNGQKNFSGREMMEGEFLFTVEAVDNAPMGSTLETNAASVTDGVITLLNNITFDKAGTYQYIIREEHPAGATATNDYTVNGVKYDTTEYRYTVVVEDVDKIGELTVTSTLLERRANSEASWVAAAETAPVFTNTYTTTPEDYTIPAFTKILLGDRKDALQAGEFTFEITASATDLNEVAISNDKLGEYITLNGQAPGANGLLGTTTNTSSGTINFGDGAIKFLKEGIYTFTVKEVIPADADKVSGVTYTEEPLVAVFRVEDNLQGQLVATLLRTTGSRTFTNEYNAVGTLQLEISKDFDRNIDGDADGWLEADSFEFEVVILDPDTQAAVDAGYIVFPTLQTDNGIQKVTIKPTEDNKNLSVKTETSPEITITKPGTYEFVVREVAGSIKGVNYDSTPRTVKVEAVDNGDGTITANVTSVAKGEETFTEAEGIANALVFENEYKPELVELSGHENLQVVKNFSGRDWVAGDKFTFELTADNIALVDGEESGTTQDAVTNGDVILLASTLEVTTANKAHAHFGNIQFKAEGTYTFTVKEVLPAGATEENDYKYEGIEYDTDVHTFRVKVTHEIITVNGVENSVLVAQRVDENGNAIEENALTFNFYNNYSLTPTTQVLEVTKELTGRYWGAEDEYKFTIASADDFTAMATKIGRVILPESATITIKGDNQTSPVRTGAFEAITFNAAGTYKFAITEEQGSTKGIAYDTRTVIVEITVSDDGVGGLYIAADGADEGTVPDGISYTGSAQLGEIRFKNTYTPDPIQVVLEGTKQLNGRGLNKHDFRFHIVAEAYKKDNQVVTAAADTPLPAVTTITNGTETSLDKVVFGAIQFTKPGTYQYKITEIEGTLAGVSYDSKAVTVVVTVVQNMTTGKLEPTVSYDGVVKAAGESGFTFVNTYTTEKTDPVNITAMKIVTPAQGHSYEMKGGEFKFVLEGPGVNETIVNEANGTIKLPALEFTEPNDDGEGNIIPYIFTLKEVTGEADKLQGVGYDATSYTIEILVTDNIATAKLQTAVTIKKNGSEVVNSIQFNNSYSPESTFVTIQGDKDLSSDHKNLEVNEFEFEIKSVSGPIGTTVPMPTVTSVKNAANGSFAFGPIEYKVPGRYVYTISEVDDGKHGYTYDDTVYTVTVTVTDHGSDGQLDRTVTYSPNVEGEVPVVFTNTYTVDPTTTSFTGTKKLDGRDIKDGEFEFALLKGTEEVVTAKNTGKTFELKLPEGYFKKADTYRFTIVEKNTGLPGVTYDSQTYEVVVVVEDKDYCGKLSVASTTYYKNDKVVEEVVFDNTYEAKPAKVMLTAQKELEGRKLEAGEFTFKLTPVTDEAPMPTSGNTATNNKDGVVSFGEMSYNKVGTYVYEITEVKGDDKFVAYDDSKYTVTVAITDEGKGKLTPIVTYNKSGEASENVVFTNKYTVANVIVEKAQAVNGKATKDTMKVVSGDVVTYAMGVSNIGTTTAKNIVVIDKIPAGLELVKDSITGGDKFTITEDGTISWTINELAAGKHVVVSFQVKVPTVEKETTWTNVATFVYDNDPDNADNPEGPVVPKESNKVTLITKKASPITGDSSLVVIWTGLAFASIMLSAILVVNKKRRSN